MSIYGDNNLIKVMHSYDNDLRWLTEDFGLRAFKCVVDTCKIHLMSQHKLKNERAQKSFSLKELGLMFVNYEMSKDFQRADWRIRPLISEMFHYAAIDAEILLPLYCIMISKV